MPPSSARKAARLAFYLGDNWLSTVGAALTTASALTLLWFWLLEVTSPHRVHPYAGLILFLILPAFFVLGLLLMPVGIWLRRRKLAREGAPSPADTPIDWRGPGWRHLLLMVGGLTVVNVAILGTATYKGVEHMESSQFCGLTCHTVMQPEYTAFLDSPHSRVGCVQCHVGEGATWYIKSKLNGLHQVYALALDNFERPVPAPVKDLRPARDTCETCHWPQKPIGDRMVVRTSFAEDEKNTPSTTVLVLKVGGGPADPNGIHGRHLDPRTRIRYVTTDEQRKVIPKVTLEHEGQEAAEYLTDDKKAAAEVARGETRQMDCLDCHNRPSHTFERPERALDQALADGRIERDLPFVKKKALELLRTDYPDRDTATRKIAAGLDEFYRTTYADLREKRPAAIEGAGKAVGAIYLRNVFPAMKVTWGTHPNFLGHDDAAVGCFRCHDESHTAKSGKAISQDCNACHTILAQDEANPKVLADLGLTPAWMSR